MHIATRRFAVEYGGDHVVIEAGERVASDHDLVSRYPDNFATEGDYRRLEYIRSQARDPRNCEAGATFHEPARDHDREPETKLRSAALRANERAEFPVAVEGGAPRLQRETWRAGRQRFRSRSSCSPGLEGVVMKRRRVRPGLLESACCPPAWCADCRVNTTPCTVRRRRGERACPTHYGWEYYMVTDEVWAAARGPTHARGFRCVGCLERRLGRRLRAADFTVCSLNDDGVADSARLLERKLYSAEAP